MVDELTQWEGRLAEHFRELSNVKRVTSAGVPVFALEHGLEPTEVDRLSCAIRQSVAHRPPSLEHALSWIVYTAELGYRYSGDEYWQTFEAETPGWIAHGNRYWIRDRYLAFHRDYGGAKPSGSWAEQFSIICWPITHAILPLDLQRQLARILYEIRHGFSAETFESTRTLGEVIEAHSWNATSRFQNLAQATELVGQIAAALLLQGEFGTNGLLHPATLERISRNLDEERRAREWLRGAQGVARERVQVRGLGLGLGLGHRPPSSPTRQPDEARAELAALGIEPRLTLRPSNAQSKSWDVELEIPSLSHLLLRFPSSREVLTEARCHVAGALGRPLARGRCLYGSQRVVLSRWPQPAEVLLEFERRDAVLDFLLRTECLLRPGSRRLFRVASDGLAYELRGLHVRPGNSYILASTGEPLATGELIQPAEVRCSGVHAAFLDLPMALTPDWEEALRALGVSQSKMIEVWPAGLSAIAWDGEGHGEWPATERPCLGLRVDHSVDALVVSMDGNAENELELRPVTPGESIFIELPEMSVGVHRVHVAARQSRSAPTEVVGDLDVVMRMREVRPWAPGLKPNGPLLVQLDPPAPTLEQLWEDRYRLSIDGPGGRTVKIRLSLHETEDDPAPFTMQLPSLQLPVPEDDWRAHFHKHARRVLASEGRYDLARICTLDLVVDELGSVSLRFQREFRPVRWLLRHRKQGYALQLLDDSGGTENPRVVRVGFETPTVEEPLSNELEYAASDSGGMYVGFLGQHTSAIIVPPMIRSLNDLSCMPRLVTPIRSIDSILSLVTSAGLWESARLPGDLFSASRKRNVLRALANRVAALVCGENWEQAEAGSPSDPEFMTRLGDAVSRRPEERSIGVVLTRDHAELSIKGVMDRVKRLESIMTRFGILSSVAGGREDASLWMCEFALRLASDPGGVGTWAGDGLRNGIRRLMEVPTLARAGRFLVLAVERSLQAQASPTDVHTGWEWQ